MSGDAVGVSVVSGIALVIVVWIGRVIYRALLTEIAQRASRIEHTTERLVDEVTPNGGNTQRLGDRVLRTERNISHINGRIDELRTQIDTLSDLLEEVLRRRP